jgi:hypothetical protein
MLPPFPARFLPALGAMLAPAVASGQVMLSPVAVVGTDLGSCCAEAPLANLINQSGVEKPFISGTTDFDTYFAVPHQTFAMNGPANNWQSDVAFTLPLHGYVDFDLGASHRVSQLALWNVTAKDITVSFSEDLAGLATAPVAGSFALVSHASFSFSYAVDLLPFSAPQQGRYLRLAINSAHLIAPGLDFTYAILGEVVASMAPAATPAMAIAREPNGDVTVTFTGTLQAAPTADGVFENVPGNPQGTYTVPKAGLSAQQCYRSRSN